MSMCLDEKTALKIIFAIGIAGLLFSGYLTWGEMFAKPKCEFPAPQTSCGANVGLTSIFGLPVCIYGFFMYLLITCISGYALCGGKKQAGKKKK
jgi:hypothetical protein